ncbi:MAG: hypothetical protein P8J32_06505 [bacterium]|jgi:hypothetical protein|nr:hypothetical protein [bacterium]
MTFQTQSTEEKDDQWNENEWGAEDDGMGFGTDVKLGEDSKEEEKDPELAGMGSDIEAPVEEEREL